MIRTPGSAAVRENEIWNGDLSPAEYAVPPEKQSGRDLRRKPAQINFDKNTDLKGRRGISRGFALPWVAAVSGFP